MRKTTIALLFVLVLAAAPLLATNIRPVFPGIASSLICLVAGGSSCNLTLQTKTYASSIALDFSSASIGTVTLTGVLTITTSGLAAGRSYTLRIVGDGSERALTLPDDWDFVGAVEPPTIAASKVGVLSLMSFGTTDADVVAAWAVEP